MLEAAEQLNYVPLGAARSLAVRHHEAHGLVLPELSGPYYSELLMGFESRAAELGQSVVLMLAEGKADLPRAVRQLATRVDGIAMLGSAAIPESAVPALQGSQAARAHRRRDPREGVEAVSAENTESARALTAHLLDHGRRRLLFVGDPGSGPDIRDRYARVRRRPTRAGSARRRPSRVRIPLPRGATAPGWPSASSPARPDADALVCANDELALSIMARLQRGRQARPRRHRRRRLGRRDDRPLRPSRDSRPSASRCASSARWPPTGCTSGSPAPPPDDGLQVLPTQLVHAGLLRLPTRGIRRPPTACDPHTV